MTIPLFKVHYPENIGQKIQEVFESGFITEGEYSDRFEQTFGTYVDNENCSLVNSCTSALTLAYRMAGVGPGDEVISTPMTCMATNEPIDTAGASIVWADINPKTGNICPQSVKKRITQNTKAIVAVHWAGQPFDIEEINQIANDHGIFVIEDAAHALGAEYRGQKIGSHSDFVCFSFQAIKHLTTADGGAICSRSKHSDNRIRKLKWFGLDRKYQGSKWEQDITESGYKFHMNNINAVIGLEQMRYIDKIIYLHQKNGNFLDEHITNKNVTKLDRPNDRKSAHWIYSLLVENPGELKEHLSANGIASDFVHVRNDRYSVFKKFKSQDRLVGCDYFCSRMLNLPVGWWLSDLELERIVDTVNSYKKTRP
jgi:perosamine synthetase